MVSVASEDRVRPLAGYRAVPPREAGAGAGDGMRASVQRPGVPARPRTPDRELAVSVAGLYTAFRAAALPLDLPGAGSLREERARILGQADDYVLPRLAAIDAPALVVVSGPTGVGKSTLVNSLAGRKVTSPGLLRPTTRSPVLVHHPDDREWFGPDRVLPTLDRVDQPTSDPQAIQLVPSATVPQGVAILDAPDFDSIDDRNRELATKLLAAADVLLFVTSAARYSDQVAWLQLSMAIERETAVTVVMNRIPVEDRATVMPHLSRMLDKTGVPADQVFFVEHGPVADDTLLPASYVADIRRWIDALAASAEDRSAAIRQTVRGAVRRAITIAEPVADAARLQVEAVNELLTVADHVYAEAADELRSALGDGSLVRGDLLVQWQDLAGTDASVTPGRASRAPHPGRAGPRDQGQPSGPGTGSRSRDPRRRPRREGRGACQPAAAGCHPWDGAAGVEHRGPGRTEPRAGIARPHGHPVLARDLGDPGCRPEQRWRRNTRSGGVQRARHRPGAALGVGTGHRRLWPGGRCQQGRHPDADRPACRGAQPLPRAGPGLASDARCARPPPCGRERCRSDAGPA